MPKAKFGFWHIITLETNEPPSSATVEHTDDRYFACKADSVKGVVDVLSAIVEQKRTKDDCPALVLMDSEGEDQHLYWRHCMLLVSLICLFATPLS